MDKTRLNGLISSLKTFLIEKIEKKNQKLFMPGVLFLLLFLLVSSLLIVLSIKQSKKQSKKIQNTILLPTPTKIPEQKNEEIIQSLGYSIDCQLVVTTSLKKIYVKKLKNCSAPLSYSISQSKRFAVYMLTEKNKASQLFVYSLENNVEGQLQIISQPIIAYFFDKRDNFAVLLKDTLIYYFIPLLFSEYPENYYNELNTFTNIDKRKVEISLPESKDSFTKIEEKQEGLALTDSLGGNLYVIAFKDLEAQLSPPTPSPINKNLLSWNKRLFIFSKGEFKTMDIDGSNEFTHQFICDGINVIPINFRSNFMARSPDGKTLVFLVPTEEQMRDNPAWKVDVLAGKKVFDKGEIVIYDLIKGDCQKTGVVQTIQYRENISFSPNGLYFAFVNKGVNLYNLQTHQDYQLSIHNPTQESDSTAVTGPLVWDGESKFIYTLVSKITNESIASTKLVRIYFNERLDGTEQDILTFPNETLYSVSPDGSKILYTKDKQIFKYDVDRKLNSLFSTSSIDKIDKLVWLRNGTIVSNLWYANESLYFTNRPEMTNFQVDFGGGIVVYSVRGSNEISLYDLGFKRQKFFKDKRIVEGNILQMFY